MAIGALLLCVEEIPSLGTLLYWTSRSQSGDSFRKPIAIGERKNSLPFFPSLRIGFFSTSALDR